MTDKNKKPRKEIENSDEETAEVLEHALYNLWSVVNDLAKIKPNETGTGSPSSGPPVFSRITSFTTM